MRKKGFYRARIGILVAKMTEGLARHIGARLKAHMLPQNHQARLLVPGGVLLRVFRARLGEQRVMERRARGVGSQGEQLALRRGGFVIRITGQLIAGQTRLAQKNVVNVNIWCRSISI